MEGLTVPAPIPQPEPIELTPPPPAPAAVPAHSAVMVVRLSGFDEVAVVHKRSYRWTSGNEPQRLPADEEPLRDKPKPWPEAVDGRGPSYRELVDAHAWRTGVDLLIRGTARAPRPVGSLRLAVAAGGRTVAGIAWGVRRVARSGSTWAFSEPEPFQELVLRDEFAYGGSDPAAEQRIIADALARMTPEQRRRAGPSVQGALSGHRPLAYPRNPHGMGYVLDSRPDEVVGRELPRLERAEDLLTPARLVLPAPFGWVNQPLPLLWSGLPPYVFPRIAMAGAPPTGYEAGAACPEVARGYLHAGFCHGNVHTTTPQDLPKLLDPAYVRNADLALVFERLEPGSRIELAGFDAAGAGLLTAVPRDRPIAELPDPAGGKKPLRLGLTLNELVVDADAGVMHAIFTGRSKVEQTLLPAALARVQAGLRIVEGAR